MIISDTKRFIFVHIPKTAGSSIQSVLLPHGIEKPSSQWARFLRRFDLPNDYQKFRFTLHTTLQDVQKKMPADVFEQYQKVAFVRNPWDRMVSSYAYKINGTKDKVRRRNDSFEEFVNLEIQRNEKPQIEYLKNAKGEFDCDFIGRFENLAEDYVALGEKLSIELPALPVLNKSKGRGSYQDFYNDKTRDLVAQHYAADIEFFDYKF